MECTPVSAGLMEMVNIIHNTTVHSYNVVRTNTITALCEWNHALNMLPMYSGYLSQ